MGGVRWFVWPVLLLPVLGLTSGAVAEGLHGPDDAVQAMFNTLGPAAVFLLLVVAGAGLHFPEDLIIIPAGWEIATDRFPLWWTVVAAYLGVVFGDTGWFFVWWRWGPRLLKSRKFRRRLHPRRILIIKRLFDRYGLLVLMFARCIPCARAPAVAVAGLMRVRWRVFLLVEFPMAALTVAIQLVLGYYAQKGLFGAGRTVHWISISTGLVLIVALVVGGLVTWRYRKAHGLRMPRAKASWLKDVRSSEKP